MRARLIAMLTVAVLAAGCTSAPVGRTRSASPVARHSMTASTPAPSPTSSPPVVAVDVIAGPMAEAIDRLVDGQNVSVALGVGQRIVYLHAGTTPRIVASNQKILTSMALLDTFGPTHRIATTASGAEPRAGVLNGDLWIEGDGDPELTRADLATLAAKLRSAGVRRIDGAVMGDTSAFTREWWAPGWVPGLSRNYVTRTTALAIDGNLVSGRPEQVAAEVLTAALAGVGVDVRNEPGSGVAPSDLAVLATVRSDHLGEILARQNHDSINFDAEMLTKALGARVSTARGSTASGAAAIEAWAEEAGARAQVRDGSGLSHQDRMSVASLVTLLLEAEHEPWGDVLWASLPPGGEGTLAGRLSGVPVRAKTGTLFETPVSALSGYITSANGRRVAFSVLSRGLDKSAAVAIEDAVVRIVAGARFG
jgi:D-alanyl-D-alanine carboxypeptidase